MGQSTWRTQADKPPRRAANCDLSPSYSCALTEDVSVQTAFVPSGSLRVYFQMEGEGARACAPAWLYRGYLKIVDRKKELIIRGGANIYPREIEEVLFQHPKVLEAAAV